MSQHGQELESAARLTSLVGQIGCVTGIVSIIIVGIAFAAGQFLDSRLGTNWITVVLIVGSFPITLFAIIRISLSALKRAQKDPATSADEKIDFDSEEETDLS